MNNLERHTRQRRRHSGREVIPLHHHQREEKPFPTLDLLQERQHSVRGRKFDHVAARSLKRTRVRYLVLCSLFFVTAVVALGWTHILLTVNSSPRRLEAQTSVLFLVDHSTKFRPAVVQLDTPLQSSLRASLTDPLLNRSFPVTLSPDYGGLVLTSIRLSVAFQRKIDHNDQKRYNERRRVLLYEIDDKKLDDRFQEWEDRDWKPTTKCIAPKWATIPRPGCNTFHELSIDRSEEEQLAYEYKKVRYLSHGYYRDTYLLANENAPPLPENPTIMVYPSPPLRDPDSVVLKKLRLSDNFDFGPKNFESTHKEAVILETFSSSTRFGDIYGFCGTSTLVQTGSELTYKMVPQREKTFQPVERGAMTNADVLRWQRKHGQEGPPRFNEMSPYEKLVVAIAMVESIAELHGFNQGVIVHDDLQPEQWLVSPDGRIILNDVNNAHPLPYNRAKGKYCPFQIAYGGTYRAPEEYERGNVDETADMWVVGNQIYCLLTGLWPYYDIPESSDVRATTRNGTLPYVDPRWHDPSTSFIERRLVSIMQQCHKLKPRERVDIFSVLQQLQETKNMYLERQGKITVSKLL